MLHPEKLLPQLEFFGTLFYALINSVKLENNLPDELVYSLPGQDRQACDVYNVRTLPGSFYAFRIDVSFMACRFRQPPRL